MVIVGALINQFYIIPTFAKMYCGGDINKVLGMGAAVNPLIDSVTMYVLFAAVPINLLKSVSVIALVMWLYKPLSLGELIVPQNNTITRHFSHGYYLDFIDPAFKLTDI